jgi:hypothetical protein
LGLPVELVEESETHKYSDGVFPDNWQPYQIFVDLLTQWRVGPSGITGLDYQALPVVLKIRGIKKREHGEIFDCIQIMERAALKKVVERDQSRCQSR